MSAQVEDPRLESFQTPEVPSPKPKRRVYSEQQIAKALAVVDACGGNLTEAQRLTGISDSTLSQWMNGQRRNMGNIPQIRNEQGLDLVGNFREIASQACRVGLDRLQNPRKANKIPFGQLMQGAGIAVDRVQLLSGLPTSISSSVISEDDRRLKVAELLSRIADRRQVVDVTPEPVSPTAQIDE